MTVRDIYHRMRTAFVALVLGAQALASLACTICAPPDGATAVLFQLHAADAVVLAASQPQAAGWRVLAHIKGSASPRPNEPVEDAPAAVPSGEAVSLVLVYGATAQRWRSLGPLAPQRADWLRKTLAFRPASLAPVTDWPARLAHFAAYLEDPQDLVARTAYEEVAVAPYTAMRSLGPLLRADRIRRWLDDPALAARRPLYLLLAGFAAKPSGPSDLPARMALAERERSMPALSAALAAWVEQRGPEGLAWVEQNYLTRPGLDELQVQAAVLALSVHGNDGARLPRERIVAAFAALARHQPALAGLAASDLAAWGHWELGPRYAEILQSGQPLAFAARYAMVFYLLRSPRPDARAAIEALRAAKAL